MGFCSGVSAAVTTIRDYEFKLLLPYSTIALMSNGYNTL
jgi:hypothetical protein